MLSQHTINYIDVDTESVKLNLDWVGSWPLLWTKKGLFGLIPLSRIRNALENWKDRHVGSISTPMGVFHWHDTISISPQIANALLGEDKSDKCTYKGNSTPKSS